MIEKYILEEIDEVGEFAFVFLIPEYLKLVYKKQLLFPLTDHLENYEIKEADFEVLCKSVKELIHRANLGLFEYKEGVENPTKWEDCFILLSDDKMEELLSGKKFWICDKKRPSYFLAEK